MTQANDILSRLEAASGPDRELDADIYAHIHGYQVYMHWNGVYAVFEVPGGGWEHLEALPAYTSSLDAQRSLAHPDWQVSSGNCGEDNGPWACVTTPDNVDHTGDGAATEELARLIALLKAIQHAALQARGVREG